MSPLDRECLKQSESPPPWFCSPPGCQRPPLAVSLADKGILGGSQDHHAMLVEATKICVWLPPSTDAGHSIAAERGGVSPVRGLSAAELRSSAFLTSALEIHRTSSISVSSICRASLFAFAMHPIISSQEPPRPACIQVHKMAYVQKEHRHLAKLYTWLQRGMPEHRPQYSLWQPGLAQSGCGCAMLSGHSMAQQRMSFSFTYGPWLGA